MIVRGNSCTMVSSEVAMILKIINKIEEIVGIEIHRKKRDKNGIFNRTSMRGCLIQAARNGLKPQTVIDVGAAFGTAELYEVFPFARHILIEPLKEFAPYLESILTKLEKAEYILAAAASTAGKVTINVHPDLTSSSIYLECEESNVNGVPRTVDAVTLDDVCRGKKAHGPYLIKIDTQGSELDVLRGAGEILKDTEFVIVESSLYKNFIGAPSLYDCVFFMKEHQFVIYDVFELAYRPLDGALQQVNIAFVKENSVFRKFHFYATAEQREKSNKDVLNILSLEKRKFTK